MSRFLERPKSVILHRGADMKFRPNRLPNRYVYQCRVCMDMFIRTKPRKTDKCMACDTGWIVRVIDRR